VSFRVLLLAGVAAVALGGAFLAGRYVLPDTGSAQEEGFRDGRASGLATSDELLASQEREGAIESARYASLVLDLWRTFSSMSVPIEAPDSFVAGVPAAAAQLRADVAAVEDLVGQIESVALSGQRFRLQRDVFIEGARGCLDTAKSAARALEQRDTATANALHGPLIDC
jgi:hypothetical protein